MPSLLRLCIHLSLFGLPLALAKKDENYNPASNYHPHNVTDLTGLYKWVGSYYNATTEIEVTPIRRLNSNVSLCDNVRNKPITKTYNESVLALTERAPNNVGTNPVNLWLSIIPSSFQWSELPALTYWKDDVSEWDLLWPLRSSDPFANESGFYVGKKPAVADNFNMTASKPDSSAFALSGIMRGSPGQPSSISESFHNFPMHRCSDNPEGSDWQLTLFTEPSLSLADLESSSSFHYPTMNASVDGRTANLTVNGKFYAYPSHGNWRKNGVMGDIEIRFRGVLDTYYSDILDVNSSTPTWSRTVGFGNNSLNIGNDANAAGRFSVGLTGAFVTVFSVLVSMMLSA